MNNYSSILNKIENAKELDFGNLINDSIELFKNVWLKGFLMFLIMAVFGFVISIVFQFIGLASPNRFFVDGFDLNVFLTMYASTILYSIPQTIILSTLSIAFLAAFYRICKQFQLGENSNDDYFYFFKKEYVSKLLMLGLIHTGISVAAQFMFLVPYIYVFVPLAYFSVIFAHNPELSETEIVKASFALGNKKWLITFGTMLVTFIIGMLGVIACVIGVIFTVSIFYLPVFLIYKEVVGFDDISQIDQIGLGDNIDY